MEWIGAILGGKPPREIKLSRTNIDEWPAFKKLLDDGKIVFDKKGKLRYPHGAPVGKLVLTKTRVGGTPIYQESAAEWFDLDSLCGQSNRC
jgi:hypothetical protein